jgi:hypothetical protein
MRRAPKRRPSELFAKAELADEAGVAVLILAAEVIEQRTALVDQHQQAAPRVIVFRVGLEVLGEVEDAFGEDRDLDFRRPSVALALRMFLDQRLLALGGNRHRFTPIHLKVEPADDRQAVSRGFDQRDRSSLQDRQPKPRFRGDPGKLLSMTEQLGLVGSDGEGRDVVQRRG